MLEKKHVIHNLFFSLRILYFRGGFICIWHETLNEPRIHFVFILSQINLAILRDIYIVYVQILRNQDRNTYI